MRVWAFAVIAVLLAVGCTGDDDDAAVSTTTTTRASATSTTSTLGTTVEPATTTIAPTTATTSASTRVTTTTKPGATTTRPAATTVVPTTVAPVTTAPPNSSGPADLSVSVRDAGGDASQRQFVARIDNVGPSVARSVTLNVTAPPHTSVLAAQPEGGMVCATSGRDVRCSAPDAPVGGIVGGVTVTLRRDSACMPPDVRITASVAAANPDPAPSNNQSSLPAFCPTS